MRRKNKRFLKAEWIEKTLSVQEISAKKPALNEEEQKKKSAYFLLNGAPVFSVNERDGKYRLLSGEKDFYAVKDANVFEVRARVYRFSAQEEKAYALIEGIKTTDSAMERAYAMHTLVEDGWTQMEISEAVGLSRPAVANTLRLLTLVPEVVGMVESGALSAGHARALVNAPKDKQYAFALETVRKNCSVRETERAIKVFLTPPEILQSEKDAKNAAKNAELKELVERMRRVLGTKVSLIGNDKKGRIYVDYYQAEDLYRLEEMLDIVEKFRER
ncbi:MAG: hypothetical protein IIX01_05210 [Clostridia bacterium]|nr:hypothetical protein [Clostridia bacterium]